MDVSITVNGAERTLSVEPADTLLGVLRDRLGAWGTKEGCNEGECGACTVLLDGQPVDSCIYARVAADGRRVETVEGLSGVDELSPLQSALVEAGGVQCGFCTPGFVVTLTALLRETAQPTEVQIRDALVGNICRCTGYAQIIEAVVDVVSSGRFETSEGTSA